MKLHHILATAILLALAIPATAEIDIIKDIDYLPGADYDDNKDKLDIYRPASAENAPVMIFIHGGALMRGDKNGQGHIGRRFAAEGFCTVIVNHRLSPGVVHPAHIHDIAASFAWVKANIAQHGGDPRAVFVTGHSSGGYLAGLIALDPQYLAAHGHTPADIAGVVPISGFFHVDRVAPARPKSVWGDSPDTWHTASPAHYPTADLPPILCLYADGDEPARQQESQDFIHELAQAGHKTGQTHQITNRNHITIWQKLGSEDDETTEKTLAFMRGVLNGE